MLTESTPTVSKFFAPKEQPAFPTTADLADWLSSEQWCGKTAPFEEGSLQDIETDLQIQKLLYRQETYAANEFQETLEDLRKRFPERREEDLQEEALTYSWRSSQGKRQQGRESDNVAGVEQNVAQPDILPGPSDT